MKCHSEHSKRTRKVKTSWISILATTLQMTMYSNRTLGLTLQTHLMKLNNHFHYRTHGISQLKQPSGFKESGLCLRTRETGFPCKDTEIWNPWTILSITISRLLFSKTSYEEQLISNFARSSHRHRCLTTRNQPCLEATWSHSTWVSKITRHITGEGFREVPTQPQEMKLRIPGHIEQIWQ